MLDPCFYRTIAPRNHFFPLHSAFLTLGRKSSPPTNFYLLTIFHGVPCNCDTGTNSAVNLGSNRISQSRSIVQYREVAVFREFALLGVVIFSLAVGVILKPQFFDPFFPAANLRRRINSYLFFLLQEAIERLLPSHSGLVCGTGGQLASSRSRLAQTYRTILSGRTPRRGNPGKTSRG